MVSFEAITPQGISIVNRQIKPGIIPRYPPDLGLTEKTQMTKQENAWFSHVNTVNIYRKSTDYLESSMCCYQLPIAEYSVTNT